MNDGTRNPEQSPVKKKQRARKAKGRTHNPQPKDLSTSNRSKEKRKRSYVWNFIDGSDPTRNMCRGCGQTFEKTTRTGSLGYHINVCSGPRVIFDKDEAEKYLAMALLTNNIAPGFLECPWTQAWAKLLRPDYSLPGRTTFNDTLCPKAVELLKRMMEEKIANILSFCVSFDGWSSTAVRGYLGVIAHGIDQHWKLECFFLALRRVTSVETADCVARIAMEVKMLFTVNKM